MVTINQVVQAGVPIDYRKMDALYEKTTADNERVSGLIACKGTADTQLKIFTTGSVPLGVFTHQSVPGLNASDVKDSNYARDGKPVQMATGLAPFVAKGILKSGETVAYGDRVDAEDATGKIIKHVGASVDLVGVALESKTATGDDTIEFLFTGMLWGLAQAL